MLFSVCASKAACLQGQPEHVVLSTSPLQSCSVTGMAASLPDISARDVLRSAVGAQSSASYSSQTQTQTIKALPRPQMDALDILAGCVGWRICGAWEGIGESGRSEVQLQFGDLFRVRLFLSSQGRVNQANGFLHLLKPGQQLQHWFMQVLGLCVPAAACPPPSARPAAAAVVPQAVWLCLLAAVHAGTTCWQQDSALL